MRGDKARKAALEKAKQLEASGNVEEAVRAYRDADAVMEAAALLARHTRYADAGRLLVHSLGVEPEAVGMLDALHRKRAAVAASYFAKAKEVPSAVTLFVSLGQHMRAAELLEQSGDLLAAQRLREGRGRGPVASAGRGPAVIDKYHREGRGWESAGYHFVIGNGTGSPDGSIEVGPRWLAQEAGAHCRGHNRRGSTLEEGAERWQRAT